MHPVAARHCALPVRAPLLAAPLLLLLRPLLPPRALPALLAPAAG